MENFTVAVGGGKSGSSPIMPYIGRKIDGDEIAQTAKLHTQIALLRCGIDVVDIPEPVAETQDFVTPIFRGRADAAVMLSLAAFGSRKTFNDIGGCVTRAHYGRFYTQSRTLAEDICAKLGMLKSCRIEIDGEQSGANCAACIVEIGYLTCFTDVRLACDPDYVTAAAEHVAMGICENLSTPYVSREDMSEYLVMPGNAIGKRGRKIRLLQMLLTAHGYKLACDGVFGKNTELALRMFCLNNDLSVGLSERTYARLLDLEHDDVSIGSRNVTAEYINRKLIAKLYDAPSGSIFTEKSLSALNELLTECGKAECDAASRISVSSIPELTKVGGGRPRLF